MRDWREPGGIGALAAYKYNKGGSRNDFKVRVVRKNNSSKNLNLANWDDIGAYENDEIRKKLEKTRRKDDEIKFSDAGRIPLNRHTS